MCAIMRWGAVLLSCWFLSPAASAESAYVRKEPANRLVIVFVHGVIGDAVGTWTNSATRGYWPRLLTDDKEFNGANIFVVDYPSPAMGRSLSIDELSESMRMTLESQGVLDHSDIVFVAHSMGGLVTRAYLLKYRSVAGKVRMIYFFATPGTGSAAASISRIASRNPQFSRMATMTSDSYLADVQRGWLAAPELTALPSFCAYEVQDTYGMKVVEQQSATSLCNRRLDPIDANHVDIVKPRGRDDAAYLAFRAAYVATAARPNRMLRMEVQGLRQIRDTIEKAPLIGGERVFCDSVGMTLIVAHSQHGTIPIRVNRISVHSEPVAEGAALKPGACAIDTLSSRPHGIVETDTFVVTSGETDVRAKFIRNAGSAVEVKADDILRSPAGTRAITLKPGEEPVGFSILVETKAKTPRRVWFTAEYDEEGPKSISTAPIIVWR